MFLLALVYVSLIAVALAAALIWPPMTLAASISGLVIALIGGIVLIAMLRRRGDSDLQIALRHFLHNAELINEDYHKRKPLERQVQGLARALHEEFGAPLVAVYARRKRGYVMVDSIEIAKETQKSYRNILRDDLEHALDSRRTILSFRQYYSGDGSKGNDPHPFEYALPIMTGGRCNFFLAFSLEEKSLARIVKPLLLALADQVGNYKFLEDAAYKHNLSAQKTQAQIESLKQELKKTAAAASKSRPPFLLAVLDRLTRIYDREQLYCQFLESLREHFGVCTAVILLSENGNDRFVYHCHIGEIALEGDSLSLERHNPALTPMTADRPIISIPLAAADPGSSDGLRKMQQAGLRCLTFLNGANLGEGIIALDCRPDDYPEAERAAFNSLCRLFGLILENLSNFEKIERLSYTDEMTGLHNYRYFYKRLQEEITRAQRFSRHLALVIFDVDGFKYFNDNYGHQSGDHLLEQLGTLLTQSVRSIDIVSRYGGEEFCIIMPDTNAAECQSFCERLRLAIVDNEFSDKFSDQKLRISVSLGGAIYPNDAQRIDRLVYCADMALLQAKSTGKNKSFMYDANLITVRK